MALHQISQPEMFALRFYLTSILLILGITVTSILNVCADDPEEVDQEVVVNTTLATPTSPGEFNEETCSKEHNGCCNELYIGEEDSLMKCFAIHSAKMPPPGDSDTSKALKFLSCFVECIYKQKKYIGKNDSINMKMVKNDAEKMYAGRPKEKEYYIKMYDFCRKDAVGSLNIIKNTPSGKAMFKDACRPYLLMVFLCQADYHKKHDCPYFRWEGNRKDGTEKMCEAAKEKCYAVDGIVVPKSLSFL
ncbi:uncharacterized protein LOC115634775 [Scaptodrosophila lebanonensis]|uniref:Uncharacterized protein LOC115634775 n=1 Tax=Drosophila lebanonensis TaxID=7225 RepID=A0A6J2UJE7_DROLE|nr:uncharacterized protein LOC115634775 [Scaptodrosophila lebanonensis]